MNSKPAAMLWIGDLAKRLGIHRETAEKYFLRGILEPDFYVFYGGGDRPVFSETRLKEFRQAIEDYRQNRRSARA